MVNRLALVRRGLSGTSGRNAFYAAQGPAAGDVIVERPSSGLARGKYAWPPWAIALLGAGVVLTTLVYFLLKLRSGRRR